MQALFSLCFYIQAKSRVPLMPTISAIGCLLMYTQQGEYRDCGCKGVKVAYVFHLMCLVYLKKGCYRMDICLFIKYR